MRRVEGQVTEERAIFVLPDELHRVIGQVVDDEAFAADEPAVVLQDRAEVVAPVAGAEAVILLEAAGVRVIRILHAVVPLPERGGRIPGCPERVADGLLVQIEPLAPGRRAVNPATRMVAPGEELGPRRRADRADIEPVEQRPVPGQRIDVRRLQVHVAVNAQIPPALVVGQNNHNIRPAIGRTGRFGWKRRADNQNCE